MVARGLLVAAPGSVEITPSGRRHFVEGGIDIDGMHGQRRPLCRHCLDWSVRRHHLGGALAAALLVDIFANGWARKSRASRAIVFTIEGESAFRQRYRV